MYCSVDVVTKGRYIRNSTQKSLQNRWMCIVVVQEGWCERLYNIDTFIVYFVLSVAEVLITSGIKNWNKRAYSFQTVQKAIDGSLMTVPTYQRCGTDLRARLLDSIRPITSLDAYNNASEYGT